MTNRVQAGTLWARRWRGAVVPRIVAGVGVACALHFGLGCDRNAALGPGTPPAAGPAALAAATGRPRIVSLSPAATEALCAVGCCDRIVLRDGWSDTPPAVLRVPAVEGFAPSAEAILAIAPDLVVGHFPPPGLHAALAAAGVRVIALAPVTLSEVSASLVALADACGQPAAGRALRRRFDGEVAAVRARLAGVAPVRVFYEMDAGDPGRPFTLGRGTFGHAVLEAAGGANVFADAGAAWFQVSAESVLAADPDVIVLADADVTDHPQSVRDIGERPGWRALRAVQTGRVVAVQTALLSRPGPRLPAGLRALARALHPAAFAGEVP